MKKKEKGFTLIELLATIVILAIIMLIVGFFAKDVIGNTKNKSYEVTKNEISVNTNSYLLERKDLHFVPISDTSFEYQCITVENLINYGYLKDSIVNSKVADDTTVLRDGYIYIERDAITHAIRKAIYIGEDNIDYNCSRAVKAQGKILFDINPDNETWSNEKKVVITYETWNINDVRTIDKYNYVYQYYLDKEMTKPVDGISGHGKLIDLDNGKTGNIAVSQDGWMYAKITFGDNEFIVEDKAEVKKLDTVGPTVTIGNTNDKKPNRHVLIPLILSDYGSGARDGTFTSDDLVVTVGGRTIGQNESDKEKYSLDSSGDNKNFVLDLTHYEDNGRVILEIAAEKLFDNCNNPNVYIYIDTGIDFENKYTISFNGNGGTANPATKEYVYGNYYGSFPSASRTGYYRLGWYTEASGGTMINTSDIMTFTDDDHTFYAHWQAHMYTVTFDANGGSTAVPGIWTVTFGSKYGKMATTSRSSYTFNGWYTAASGGTKVTADTIVSIAKDHTLYAQWTYNPPASSGGGGGGGSGTVSCCVTGTCTKMCTCDNSCNTCTGSACKCNPSCATCGGMLCFRPPGKGPKG